MPRIPIPKTKGRLDLSKVHPGDEVFVESIYHPPGTGFKGTIRDLKITDRRWMEVNNENLGGPYSISYPCIVQDRVFVVVPENDNHGREPGVYLVKPPKGDYKCELKNDGCPRNVELKGLQEKGMDEVTVSTLKTAIEEHYCFNRENSDECPTKKQMKSSVTTPVFIPQ